MKLFLKHILRSIKSAPVQPFIILMTLAVSVGVFVTSARIALNIFKENLYQNGPERYVCDITVKPSSADSMRFLLADDIEKAVGNSGKVLGEFELSGLINQGEESNIVNICALNLEKADVFYGFRFVEYGSLTEQNLNNSIIISTSAAQKYNITLGDKLPVCFLNQRFDLNVAAIALPDGVLNKSFGIINIGAVSETIAKANPSLAAGIANFTPFTSVRVKLNDKSRTDEFASLISAASADSLVIKESENVGVADYANLLSTVVIVSAIIIVLIICTVVTTTSLDLLRKKRIQDSALFMICGAETGDLSRLIYLECLLYGGLGAILGELLSLVFFKYVNSIFEWSIAEISFEFYDIIIALISSLVIILAASYIHIKKSHKLSLGKKLLNDFNITPQPLSYRKLWIIFALTAALFITALLIPVKYKFLAAFGTMLLFVVMIYCILPYITTLLSGLLMHIIKCFKIIPPKTALALTNNRTVYSLQNATRLITVLATLVFTVIPCLSALSNHTSTIEEAISCDYISPGADKRAENALSGLDSVENVFRMAIIDNAVTGNGTAVLAISAKEGYAHSINQAISPQKLPKNDEIAISSGLSIMSGKGVGDNFTLISETQKYEFTVTEVIKTGVNIVFIDAGYIGKDNDLLCITTKDDISAQEYARISNTLEVRGAIVVERDTVLLPLTNRIQSFSRLGIFIILIAACTTFLGILNVLISSHIYRKNEKKIYYTIGMTKRQILGCETLEITTVLLFSALLVPIFSLITTQLLDIAGTSFGVDLFY